MNALGFQELKVIALAVNDLKRAEDFYRNTLDLEPASLGGDAQGFALGNQVIMLKPAGEGGIGRPSAELNPRLTIAVEDARHAEKMLKERGVTVSDPVALYEEGRFCVGGFLDSEGNKLWFCSPNQA